MRATGEATAGAGIHPVYRPFRAVTMTGRYRGTVSDGIPYQFTPMPVLNPKNPSEP
jgi:hypothetical protein